jgi:hypothetical protein
MDVHAMADFYTLDIYRTHIKTQVEYSCTRMNDASFIIMKEEDREKAEEKVEHKT